MIRITSRRHNFRRCGMPHPKGPVEYPGNKFSEKEIDVLRAEPMLTVEVVESKPKPKTKPAKAAKPKPKSKPKEKK